VSGAPICWLLLAGHSRSVSSKLPGDRSSIPSGRAPKSPALLQD
jgi:hypothetical protein